MPGGDGGDPFGWLKYDPERHRFVETDAEAWANSGEFFSGFESSNVRAISYDRAGRTLAVEYDDGRRQYYRPVTLAQAVGLYEAPSKGIWLWDNVRIRGTVHGHQVDTWQGGL